MKFLTAVHTDAGIRKKKNQDSVIVMEAQTGAGNILFASVCDGMGGLERGEAASAAMVRAFGQWFETDLPALAKGMQTGEFREEKLWEQWTLVIDRANRSIGSYGRANRICLGTTAVGVLLSGEQYYTVNVGDSRVYLLTDTIRRLTKDQTYVQQEMDEGRMTYEGSLTDQNRNVLLQCVGADSSVSPAFGHGRADAGQAFLLCSDGFRHVITEDEICRALRPSETAGEELMKLRLEALTGLAMERGETDNISGILIRLVQERPGSIFGK